MMVLQHAGAGFTADAIKMVKTRQPEKNRETNKAGLPRSGHGHGLQSTDHLQRASADPEGKPWSEAKKYVWWDEGEKRMDRT